MIEHIFKEKAVPYTDWDKVIDIENRREFFWDSYLVDEARTTARLHVNRPVKLPEPTFRFDAPWEGNGFSFPDIVPFEGGYRMYYQTGIYQGNTFTGSSEMKLCVIESKDGITWTRPNVGIFEFNGSKDNNIVMTESEENLLDNFFVFRDENPDCLPEEKYKVTSLIENPNATSAVCARELWCYTSPDGLHFTKRWKMTDGTVPNGGIFDSMNVAYWDSIKKKYVAYVRGIHDGPGRGTAHALRDIRYMESDDYKNWTNPVLLDYQGADDYELYTNNIMRYYRAPHVMIGFPTRYTERHWWTRNNDFLCGPEGVALRKQESANLPRVGFVLTDGLFMSSRDGLSWHRFDEALFSADGENPYNWMYGDGYPAYGMIETPRPHPHNTNEISMYLFEGKKRLKPVLLYRYVTRLDGFGSYRADYEPKTVCTKPLMFTGDTLTLNFKTSGRGYVHVRILDYYGKPFDGYSSYEIYGDAYDRPVLFSEDSPLSKLHGKPIRLEFTMSDADIYSFKFD